MGDEPRVLWSVVAFGFSRWDLGSHLTTLLTYPASQARLSFSGLFSVACYNIFLVVHLQLFFSLVVLNQKRMVSITLNGPLPSNVS